jgi:hypothetical protein
MTTTMPPTPPLSPMMAERLAEQVRDPLARLGITLIERRGDWIRCGDPSDGPYGWARLQDVALAAGRVEVRFPSFAPWPADVAEPFALFHALTSWRLYPREAA